MAQVIKQDWGLFWSTSPACSGSIFMRAPLKYLWYTPTFHSLHHSKVHTNYCLFMPIYDYLFGTVCPATEKTYIEATSRGKIPRPGTG